MRVSGLASCPTAKTDRKLRRLVRRPGRGCPTAPNYTPINHGRRLSTANCAGRRSGLICFEAGRLGWESRVASAARRANVAAFASVPTDSWPVRVARANPPCSLTRNKRPCQSKRLHGLRRRLSGRCLSGHEWERIGAEQIDSLRRAAPGGSEMAAPTNPPWLGPFHIRNRPGGSSGKTGTAEEQVSAGSV